MNEQGFPVFYIAALICGSLFSIDRDLLLRATVKILPTAVIGLAAGCTVVGLLSLLMGYSFLEGILMIAIPMTSGGMTPLYFITVVADADAGRYFDSAAAVKAQRSALAEDI